MHSPWRRAWLPAFAAWLAACGGSSPGVSQRASILRVPLPRDILTLDPADAGEITTYDVVRQLYEGLVDYDPCTLEVVPRIARSWNVSPDGLAWRFEIRPGVRFIDDPCFPAGKGRELTAEDARFSIERGLGRSRGPGARAPLPAIAGLEEFLSGGSERVSGISVGPGLVLGVRLVRPDPTLVHFLARHGSRIVPREAVLAYGEDLKNHAVGTGPFRVVSWEPLSGILLVRNRGYWMQDEREGTVPSIDALRFVPTMQEVGGRLFAQGKLDVATSLYPYAGPEEQGARTFLTQRLNTIYVRFDYRSDHPLVREARLRRAMSLAVPRGILNLSQAARGLFPPGLPGYDPALEGQRTDPIEAARLLRAGGYPLGMGLPVLRLAWREWDRGVAEQVVSALRRLGVRVDLKLYTDGDYEGAVRGGQADAFRSGWIADEADPQNFLELFYSGAPENLGGYSRPRFDALFEILRKEARADGRLDLARHLERILVEDTAAVFLHHERQGQLVSSRIENWEANGTNGLGIVFYERLKLRPAARSGG